MGEDYVQAKRLLRQQLRGARERLPADAAAWRSEAACSRVRGLRAFQIARRVVVYATVAGEVDVSGLARTAVGEGKSLYYPRMTREGRIEFLRGDAQTLRPGRFAVPEPPDGERLTPDGEATLFVVPGLAFDLRGVRLGRGAGCYDRALATYPDAARLGIAFEFQIMPCLPHAHWDLPMSAVVTEARVIGEATGHTMKETPP